jgi:hypothetical protein
MTARLGINTRTAGQHSLVAGTSELCPVDDDRSRRGGRSQQEGGGREGRQGFLTVDPVELVLPTRPHKWRRRIRPCLIRAGNHKEDEEGRGKMAAGHPEGVHTPQNVCSEKSGMIMH